MQSECWSISNCNPEATSATSILSTSGASSAASSAASPALSQAASLAAENSVLGNTSSVPYTSEMGLGRAHIITAAPFKPPMSRYMSNSSLTQASECLLQEAYYSLQGPGHSLDGLKDACVLWDSTCSGNKSLATTNFYGSIMNALTQNECFYDASPDCTKKNPIGRMSALHDVRDWMRSPQCFSENPQIIYLENDPNEADVVKEELFWNDSCCGRCMVGTDRIDVYYWPDAHANTSCLSIVGDKISDLAAGATTDEYGIVYWGCTSPDSSPPSGVGSLLVVTTAILTSVESMTFRSYLYNPWIKLQCETSSTSLSSDLDTKRKPRDIRPSILPRGHTLVAPNGSMSTAVLGNFTL